MKFVEQSNTSKALIGLPAPQEHRQVDESVFRDRWRLPEALKPGSNPGETTRTIKGLLMGESTLSVRECYLQAGVLPAQGRSELLCHT